MKLKKTLQDLMKVVIEEANRNPEFAKELETALGLEPKPEKDRVIDRIVEYSVARAKKGEAFLR